MPKEFNAKNLEDSLIQGIMEVKHKLECPHCSKPIEISLNDPVCTFCEKKIEIKLQD